MKTTTLALAASTASLVAAQQYTSIETIIADLKNITNATNTLVTLADNIKPTDNLLAALPLNQISTQVQATLNETIEQAKNLPNPLPPAEGIKIIPYIQQLGNATVDAIAAFIHKQSFFIDNGAGEIVLSSLRLQNSTSYDFNEQIAIRNAANLQAPSAALARPILHALGAGVTAFENNGTKCNSVDSCYIAAGYSPPGQQMQSGATAQAVVAYSAVLAAAVGFAAVL